MKNFDKFMEIFKIKPEDTKCPIYCKGEFTCELYGTGCKCGDWWELEYKEKEEGDDIK